MTRYAAGNSLWPLLIVAAFCAGSRAEDRPGAARFRDHVQPILENYCYGCHGNGSNEGGRTLDEFASDDALLGNVDLWWAVLKNVRSNMMPPAGEDRPNADERKQLLAWINADVFGVNPNDPDPGHVTIRRLNRVEYRNTIRDLMGVEFDVHENFPPDDSGYGFDNIGDALSVSPLLLEKYMHAAETIVAEAVPLVSKVVAEKSVWGNTFQSEDGKHHGNEMSFYEPAKVAGKIRIDRPAMYRLIIEARIDGYYELDPGRCSVTCEFNGQKRFKNDYEWRDGLKLQYVIEEPFEPGEYPMSFELKPQTSADQKIKYLNFCVDQIRVQGPLDKAYWVAPKNYDRFFPDGPPPDAEQARDEYARKVLANFATRAYRRPVDDATTDRLAALAKRVYQQPDRTFEDGVAQAMVAVLSSPRFLFLIEEPGDTPEGKTYPWIDEYALAARLSYFLWSTMPDQELLDLAAKGELRNILDAQVERMLKDGRSDAFVADFTGQWLQARDVETISIDPVAALGFQKEWEEVLDKFRALRAAGFGRRGERRRRANAEQQQKEEQEKEADEKLTADEKAKKAADEAAQEAERQKVFEEFRKFRELREKFSSEVRQAMRRETEMSFAYVMRDNRSVLELLDSNYTFLNQKLAEFYGLPGVEGDNMRRVELPPESPRGGVLTQGTMLVVTSNPTRTSPVKRGLFVLDNILGTPAPPPPNAVPPLEASAEAITEHPPTLREALDRHRADPLCAGCHARMDPLGLALENFNALGQWRDSDHDRPIETAGTLLTGESFQDVRDLKKMLKTDHRLDFYRCLTEKMLTYALGRGLQYYDEYTVDQIVSQLDEHDGQFSVLLQGVIKSAAFQQQRRLPEPGAEQQARHDPTSTKQEAVP